MNKGLLILSFLLLVAGGVFYHLWETDKLEYFLEPDYLVCARDSDCILVAADCCSCANGGVETSINVRYQKEWSRGLLSKCTGVVCPAVYNCSGGEPICFSGECAVTATE